MSIQSSSSSLNWAWGGPEPPRYAAVQVTLLAQPSSLATQFMVELQEGPLLPLAGTTGAGMSVLQLDVVRCASAGGVFC
jgi:hypothetical protein